VTLSAAGGQLAVVALLFGEIEKSGTVPDVVVDTMWGILAAIALAVVVYATRRIRWVPKLGVRDAAARLDISWSPL
jgi:hypothetical protein